MTDARLYPAFILAASAAVLVTAFAFQYIGGLKPCVLCVWQRYPYAVTIALSAAALAVAGSRPRAWILGACALAFLAGAGIAAFHVGVEQHWWQGTAACTGQLTPDMPLADVLARAEAGPEPRCDQVPWSLLGISMAGYNVALSLGLAGASLVFARRLWGAPR